MSQVAAGRRAARVGTGRRRVLPLTGRRILITRPAHQSRSLADRLRRLGAQPVVVPSIGITAAPAGGPLDSALRHLSRYDWIVVTSANGARAVLQRAAALDSDARAAPVRWAAIGPATAAVLRGAGLAVAMIPSRFLTEAIASELPDVAGRRILLPRADAAGPALAQALRARGAEVDEATAYRTVLAPDRSRARARRLIGGRLVDTVAFTSASTVRGLVRLLGDARENLRHLTLVCLGPVTAAALAEEGFAPSVVADKHTMDGLVRALLGDRSTVSKGDRHARERAAR